MGKIFPSLLFLLLFLACEGSFTFNGKVVKGTVYMPDGKTPVPGAVIYVEGKENKVLTDEKGNFEIKVRSGEKLVIEKGVFKEELSAYDKDTLSVVLQPAGKIAVITGSYDKLENILARMGLGKVDEKGNLILGSEQFDLYDGNNSLDNNLYPNADALFMDNDGDGKADIFSYSMVVINCGTSYEIEFLYDDEAKRILKEYVEKGGRLVVTDTSYDFIEQIFPEYLDFLGSEDSLPHEPETMDAAEEGKGGIVVQGRILDPLLKKWLSAVACYDEGKKVPCIEGGAVRINGFNNGWAVLSGIHEGKEKEVDILVEGEVAWSGGSGVKPLTVTFKVGKGRVVYSSYHTKPHSAETLLPQERILQYLFLF